MPFALENVSSENQPHHKHSQPTDRLLSTFFPLPFASHLAAMCSQLVARCAYTRMYVSPTIYLYYYKPLPSPAGAGFSPSRGRRASGRAATLSLLLLYTYMYMHAPKKIPWLSIFFSLTLLSVASFYTHAAANSVYDFAGFSRPRARYKKHRANSIYICEREGESM